MDGGCENGVINVLVFVLIGTESEYHPCLFYLLALFNINSLDRLLNSFHVENITNYEIINNYRKRKYSIFCNFASCRKSQKNVYFTSN